MNNNEYVNKSIECSVTNCENHCSNDNFCALKKITVGAHGRDPDKMASTDCRSFVECK